MKTIHFGKNGKNANVPFWQPWGCMGCLWRVFVFFLLLLLILFLLSLFRGCRNMPFGNDHPTLIGDDTNETPYQPDTTPVGWPGTIGEQIPELPVPDDNTIQPVDSSDIITDPDNRRIVSNRLNVILDSDANDETFKSFAQQFKKLYPDDAYKIIFYNTQTKMLQLSVPSNERIAIKDKLPQQITGIDFKVFLEEVFNDLAANEYRPNDLAFQYEDLTWYFRPIQVFEAWSITQGSPDITVAIVDSYFDLNQADLRGDRIVSPVSVERRSRDVSPDERLASLPDSHPAKTSYYHGTVVAGIAVGSIDNRAFAAGIAPKCKFMPVSLGTTITSMREIEGILYAIYQGADVVNISIGLNLESFNEMPIAKQVQISQEMFGEEEDIWNYVYKIANERNCTLVWAAGNENAFTAIDPTKRNDETIKVSAVGTDLQKADFSNFGNIPNRNIYQSTISAPGVEILGILPHNQYDPHEPGTSFAAPIIAGTVALMKSLDKNLTNKEIISILQSTGKSIRGNESIGKLVQIRAALDKVRSRTNS